MNTMRVCLYFLLLAVVKLTTSVTIQNPEITWADTYKEVARNSRSDLSTKRSFTQGFEPAFDQYSLQYLDQFGGGQFFGQGLLGHEGHGYNVVALKDGKQSQLSKQEINEALLKAGFGHQQNQQSVQKLNSDAYKYVEVPEKYSTYKFTPGHSYENDHHLYDAKSNDENYASDYKFGYRVSDPHSGAEFGHSEVSEGHVTKGHYHVLLPDGRLQNVKYWADPSGYHATVSYEGQGYHPSGHH